MVEAGVTGTIDLGTVWNVSVHVGRTRLGGLGAAFALDLVEGEGEAVRGVIFVALAVSRLTESEFVSGDAGGLMDFPSFAPCPSVPLLVAESRFGSSSLGAGADFGLGTTAGCITAGDAAPDGSVSMSSSISITSIPFSSLFSTSLMLFTKRDVDEKNDAQPTLLADIPDSMGFGGSMDGDETEEDVTSIVGIGSRASASSFTSSDSVFPSDSAVCPVSVVPEPLAHSSGALLYQFQGVYQVVLPWLWIVPDESTERAFEFVAGISGSRRVSMGTSVEAGSAVCGGDKESAPCACKCGADFTARMVLVGDSRVDDGGVSSMGVGSTGSELFHPTYPHQDAGVGEGSTL